MPYGLILKYLYQELKLILSKSPVSQLLSGQACVSLFQSMSPRLPLSSSVCENDHEDTASTYHWVGKPGLPEELKGKE